MNVIKLTQGYIGTNVYIIENNGECLIIDPEVPGSDIVACINQINAIPKAILLTHGHFDHIGAVEEIRHTLNIPVYASSEEVPLLSNPDLNLSRGRLDYFIYIDHELSNLMELDLCGLKIKCLATPGHTKGGMSYLIDDHLFAGDTLFLESYGRYDFPTGSLSQLKESVNKLLELPKNTIVHSGHGDDTTIEHEQLYNPLSQKH